MAENAEPLLPVSDRISERTFSAAQNMDGMGPLQRFNAKLHLGAANTVDRVKTFINDPNVNAFTGGIVGLLRGGIIGTLAAGVGLAAFAMSPALVVPMILGTAAIMAGYQAYKSYNGALVSAGEENGAKWADSIARDAGALPAKSVSASVEQTTQPTLAPIIPQRMLPEKVQVESATMLPTPAAAPSHVEALKHRLQMEKSLSHSR